MSGCDNPSQCPAINNITADLARVHSDYSISQAVAVNTQKEIAENTRVQTKVSIDLVKISSDLKHLCKDFTEERKNNKAGHNLLFELQRGDEQRIGTLETTVEKKLGVISTNQATKLSTWDLLKIIIGFCITGTFFLGFLNYLGVFGG